MSPKRGYLGDCECVVILQCFDDNSCGRKIVSLVHFNNLKKSLLCWNPGGLL